VLFSRDFNALVEQLHLVDVYCAGSGAQLNHSKSVIMSLNNHGEAPTLEPLRSLPPGETVRYLDIPFGNFDTSTTLADQLDQRIMGRLRIWKGRARTMLGRRLIVQALILSVLWYFTSTMIIPTRYLIRWQSVVTRYILYNRVSVGSSGISVVKQGLATRPRAKDGIGVPVVKISIRRQQLLLLQQIILAFQAHTDRSEVVWYRPLAALIAHRYGKYSRPWSGDFLFQDPPSPTLWRATMFSIWWRRVLQEWKRLECPHRRTLSYTRMKTLKYALISPIWWNTSRDFQVWSSRDGVQITKPVGSGTPRFRRLCRMLATMKKWSLLDFLDEGRHWPSSAVFLHSFGEELQRSRVTGIRPRDILELYRQWSQIYHRVLPHPEWGGMNTVTHDTVAPIYGVNTGNGVRFFPNLRAQDWTDLLQPIEALECHPAQMLGCPERKIHSALIHLLWLRRCLLPVIHDVMLRLFFGGVIVGSRLHFLVTRNPTVQQCVRPSCTAIEKVEHCFFKCRSLTVMWEVLWTPWSQAFITPLRWPRRYMTYRRLGRINTKYCSSCGGCILR